MCGISGIVTSPGARGASLGELVSQMIPHLAHRGPDDHGIWADSRSGVALGHRRLSIIDRSAAGHQPMLSRCGRYMLVYNGEIYNFRQLRRELEAAGETFTGHTDTEVLLAAIVHYGLEPALRRLVGMFAFGLWDRRERTLYLARDRMGQKPLYYGRIDDRFLFMSELKALAGLHVPLPAIGNNALHDFLRYGYVPGPGTIYRGFSKLPAGAYLRVRADEEPLLRVWWSVVDAARTGRSLRIDRADEAAAALNDALKTAVADRLVADVPLGVFLSGGIDSSLVTALAQAQSGRPVKTFSIGFKDPHFNEAHHARAVAAHLGTEHTELTVGPDDVLEAVPHMADVYDEPFADNSQVPTWLLCTLARRHVTAALTGDGGDELFFGYRRYFRARRAALWWPFVPRLLKSGFAHYIGDAENEGRRQRLIADLTAASPLAMYRNRVTKWQHPEAVLVYPGMVVEGTAQVSGKLGFEADMLLFDQRQGLADGMLVKVDRASMAAGLEARAPLLDHRVVELAWRLPMRFQHRSGQGKWLLRQVLAQYVPQTLTDRPKQGFGAPVGTWLRSPALREWAEDLLAPARLEGDGIFNAAPIRSMWASLQKGDSRWHLHLWYVLMFQAWYAAQRARSRISSMAAA
ncbi:MAG TPA: asparagine synthase (glutamine-hydrolyzing) [Gammaproteobacteria bacterium]|nr:asparagine synthase (glutamine-hydrolyzing) [Gammaproteobacteria bacterium]